ncbi:hypothetical protein RHMOL_Rhmol05G0242000 [Rhododendron molle]|uniref:Uncharacterized protein n=1 Tax=Rhododendron molle TaxID=49168 RepID=A0ACC0NSV8_RHOML|nr:hypothetical protein RHMOL_Rhmol05G0242000 [Rhododendron molle]
MDSPITIDNTTATATLRYPGTAANSRTIFTTIHPTNATPIANKYIVTKKPQFGKVPLAYVRALMESVWGLIHALSFGSAHNIPGGQWEVCPNESPKDLPRC